jgi:Na+/melibiose symporter-like transporter
MLGKSGNEIGPFRAIEESTLAHLTPKDIRSDVFAWYTLIGAFGSALGLIVCGWLVEALKSVGGLDPVQAYRVTFGVYAALGLVKLVLALMLSDECEPEPAQQTVEQPVQPEARGSPSGSADGEEAEREPLLRPKPPPPKPKKSIWPAISAASASILIRLCLLFAVDSLASGLVPVSWVTYFFTTKFSLPEGQLGTIFFVAGLVSSTSNLFTAALAKRIGLVQTMVFTHLPSAIFLALIPAPSELGFAMLFLILRSCLQSMDQAPRQAFLAAAVLPGERTAVMGVVNVVKTLAQSGGPAITGWLAGTGRFWVVFLVAGSMKATYDLALLAMFLSFRGREEEAEASRQTEDGARADGGERNSR